MPGPPEGFSCPHCNGHLWEVHDGGLRVAPTQVQAASVEEGPAGLRRFVRERRIDDGKWHAVRCGRSGYRVTMYVDEYLAPCNKYEVLYQSDPAGAGHVAQAAAAPSWPRLPPAAPQQLVDDHLAEVGL